MSEAYVNNAPNTASGYSEHEMRQPGHFASCTLEGMHVAPEADAAYQQVMGEVWRHPGVLAAEAALRGVEDYLTLEHSARVAQVAVGTGIMLGLDFDRLLALGIGCAIHDIGKANPAIQSLIYAPRNLTPDEVKVMRGHPAHSLTWAQVHGVPGAASGVAAYHHTRNRDSERNYGPNAGAVPGADELLIDIAACADFIDASCSQRPDNRTALLPPLALRRLRDQILVPAEIFAAMQQLWPSAEARLGELAVR